MSWQKVKVLTSKQNAPKLCWAWIKGEELGRRCIAGVGGVRRGGRRGHEFSELPKKQFGVFDFWFPVTVGSSVITR